MGNARTALFNWLFARQQGGKYILRIEDTDVERSEVRFESQLAEDMKWLGLTWDEGPRISGPRGDDSARGEYGPYRQSERMDIYRRYAGRLLSEGKAYYCFCTTEELDAERKLAVGEHRAQVYSGKCRKLPADEVARRRAAGEAAAVRLHIPEHSIQFHDMVHGAIEFSNEVVSDPIIIRSGRTGQDGIPVYNYVVVVDDIEMKITHVIRGDDHLSNTPKQVALYEALGAKVPEFAHLSTILGGDRERLSKRHGATSISSFREMGVLPEALVNYLALLGWAPTGGTRETFTRWELIKEFSLERVTPSPAIFDFQKLYWLNRHYIAKAEPERIAALAREYFREQVGSAGETATHDWFGKVVSLLAPSVDKLDELPARAALFFHFDASSAATSPENSEVLAAEKSAAVVREFAARMAAGTSVLTAERFKAIVNEVKTATAVKGKELFHPIRIAITGSHSGPEFDKLIPLIEQGSTLDLPRRVMNVRERVASFAAAYSERQSDRG